VRLDDGFKPRVNTQAMKDSPHVVADGVGSDAELVGHLLCGTTLREQVQHLTLARCQRDIPVHCTSRRRLLVDGGESEYACDVIAAANAD
jgi:hypothetical protein